MKRTNRTVRDTVIKFVENNGPQPWSKLLDVVLTVTGQPLTNRHYGSSYLDRVSKGTSAMLPTSKDSRYLVKSQDGLYHLAN